ncbi:MAG: DUF4381 domain-containing protein [Thermoanaerobaculia bacterium]
MAGSSIPDLPEDFGNPWMSNLQELELPEPVPFTFETPGWYLLGGLMTLAVVWFGWRLWKRRQANAYRRIALEELAKLDSPVGLPELLKRTALVAYPRAEVANLYGDSWLGFLDGTLGTKAFSQGAGRRLPDLAYNPGSGTGMSAADTKELFALARRWIRRHR